MREEYEILFVRCALKPVLMRIKRANEKQEGVKTAATTGESLSDNELEDE